MRERVTSCKAFIIFMLVYLLSFILFSAKVKALAIGIAPSLTSIEAERGEDYMLEIIIDVRDSGTKVPIELRCSEVDLTLRRESAWKYNLSETSEEDTCPWLSFLERKVVVEDTGGFVWKGGKKIPADKVVFAVVKIPPNAEPGYHLGHIYLVPQISTQGMGVGVGLITTAASTYVIKVPGKAVRSVKVMGVVAYRESVDKARIDVLVKNTGTVTLKVYLDSLEVLKNNTLLAKLKGGSLKIKPGETVPLSAFWVGKIEEGDYEVKAKVSWLSGDESFEGKVRITPPPPKIPTPMVVKPAKLPPFLLALIPSIILVIIFFVARKRRRELTRSFRRMGYKVSF